MATWHDLLADDGTFRGSASMPESLGWGRCEIGSVPVVLLWCDFEFQAGTLSLAAGREFHAATEAAIAELRPVVAIANSGGARMQEGPSAFVQMISATVAVSKLRDAAIPFITYLAHPTTGGVLGSWATAGDVVFAESEALVAFTGPRVAAALGTPIEPASIQTAEGQLAAGQVDDVVHRDDLAHRLAATLQVFRGTEGESAAFGPLSDYVAEGELPRGWAAVVASRGSDRLDPLDRFLSAADAQVELRGDRNGADEYDVATVLCRFGEWSVLVVGHRRGLDGSASKPSAAGVRKALRALAIADRLGLGLITVIDTAGAAISGEGEQEGMARLVSRSLHELVRYSGPSVSLLAGQGSGGIALALFPADTSLATPDSWMAPIAPEAASLIVHRDTDHAEELSDAQRLASVELAEAGIVDVVVNAKDTVPAALAALDAAGKLGADRRVLRMDRFEQIAQQGNFS